MEVVKGTGMARCNSAGAQPLSPCSALSPRNVALPGSHRQLLGRGSSALTAAGLGALSVAARGNGTKRGPVVCRSEVRPLADSTSDGNVMEFQSEEEFNQILKDAGDKLVVVDISTKTCGPCKMIYPKVVEMSLAYPDAVFLKINGDTDNNTRTLMRKWSVRAVPNFRFFRNGEQVHSHTGAKLDELKKKFAEHYGQPAKV
jgi:thioredoxin 1